VYRFYRISDQLQAKINEELLRKNLMLILQLSTLQDAYVLQNKEKDNIETAKLDCLIFLVMLKLICIG